MATDKDKKKKRTLSLHSKASKKIGGSQGPRAGMRDKGGKNRMITENFKRYRESIPLGKTPRPRKSY